MNITINPFLINTKSCNKPKAFGTLTKLDIMDGLTENGRKVAQKVMNDSFFQDLLLIRNVQVIGENNVLLIKSGRKTLAEPLGKSINLSDIPKRSAEIIAKLENLVKGKKKII